jgi:hypothetical protein
VGLGERGFGAYDADGGLHNIRPVEAFEERKPLSFGDLAAGRRLKLLQLGLLPHLQDKVLFILSTLLSLHENCLEAFFF